MQHNRALAVANRMEVRFAHGILEKMQASVGRLPPEHYAVLGGRLDDPHYVTDFQPMPPLVDQRGRFQASGSTVTLNGPFLEYYLNTSLLPFGRYFLGVMHSHPGDMRVLSGGVAGSGHGDIPSMRAHLQAAAAMNVPWRDFIAPIVTRPGDHPRVDTWIVRLDAPAPISAMTVWEDEGKPSGSTPPASLEDEALSRLYAWRERIDQALGDKSRPAADRMAEADILRSFRAIDMKHMERLLKRRRR